MSLELISIQKTFQQNDSKLVILNHLNLKIDAGRSVSIVGKSGSGKSTLLSILAGLTRPDQGEYLFLGQKCHQFSEDQWAKFRAKHVGIVFQQFHLISNLTALENVMFPLKVLNLKAEARAREILHAVGLSHREDHFPYQLSGGECQRVAIARALVNQPQLLLADEPSGNLDQETGQKVMGLLFEMVKALKTTLVLVTHDEDLAARTEMKYHLRDGQLRT